MDVKLVASIMEQHHATPRQEHALDVANMATLYEIVRNN